MRKKMAALALAAAFALPSAASASQEYVMRPGDQLQIYVMGHGDLSSRRDSSDVSYVVRPDGKLDFPLIGEIDIEGKTVKDFTAELERRLSEYIVNPSVTVNMAALGRTRVFVLGEVRSPGLHELSKSHRVLDAIGAAGGFTQYSAKKNVFLIREGREDSVEKLNINNYLRKGDHSQNVELREGDCLYFTSNGKIDFNRDIMPWLTGYYYIERIND